MRYLSVCSGIEAASAAWHPLGWKPLAFSEIEPFPRAVLAHHYPNVPVHGDFTQLREQPWIVDADVLVGGTPCQAFSVAGLRNSLADDRGNLTLEFVRLANAIDDLRRADGRDPAIIVWENVPGVLSVKDNALGCFLAALVGNDAPLVATGGKWTNAGLVVGPKRAAAWRILDAQYFGVAQRRRRVFVVASARDGFDPAAVLFEPEGVRRDTPPSREAGERPSGTIAARFGASRNNHEECVAATVQARMGMGGADHETETLVPEIAGALDTQCGGGKLTHQSVANGHLIGTITARMFNALGTRDVEEGALLAVTHSLRGEGFDASEDGTGRGTPLVPVAFRWQNDTAGIVPDDCAASLKAKGTTTDERSVGAYVAFHPTQDPISSTDGTTHAMGTGSKGGQASVAVAFTAKDYGGDAAEEIAPTLRSMSHDKSHANGGGQLAVGFYTNMGTHGGGVEVEQSPTLKAGTSTNNVGMARSMAVRRLTPRECERLQGFPDDYTLIPWRGKPAADCPDGPRYKACGNSMAVPVMRWIGERIAKEVTR